ncbi:MAG TPA: leucyl aminopeptidase [Cyclobacteriaceae bacterium]|nr:leucyl aminopeptidase [Cyclobacteriaceae bacterium]
MLTSIRLTDSPFHNHLDEAVIFIAQEQEIISLALNEEEKSFLRKALFENQKDSFLWSRENSQCLFITSKQHASKNYLLENARKSGAKAWVSVKDWEAPKIFYFGQSEGQFQAFLEGLLLTSYSFDKYKSKKNKALSFIEVSCPSMDSASLREWETTVKATFEARDLVNEPVSHLDTLQLGEEITRLGEKYGFETELLDKTKIASLKMAGLLAVNAGSKVPPLFAVLKHVPKSSKNQAPIVLVGKGIVYDTGGLSLKPTANSMDFMKSDMAGAAAVIGAFCAISSLDLPMEVIGLIPITDNRPGYNAMAPGDIITYANGKTVEILNTDAEGRLVLADALIYAKKYKPQLVIDLATLTGSAAAAIGKEGAVMMGTASKETKESLTEAGSEVFERLVEFPLWEEYDEQIQSEIADITNLGGPMAGAITAGKFLEHFIDYEWIHIDIAGPSFNKKPDNYRPAGGTGFGVRLLHRFFEKYLTEKE